MQVTGIHQGMVALTLTREDCYLLARACDAGAEHLVDEEKMDLYQYVELASSVFLACAGALAAQEHLVPEHREALSNDLAALGLE